MLFYALYLPFEAAGLLLAPLLTVPVLDMISWFYDCWSRISLIFAVISFACAYRESAKSFFFRCLAPCICTSSSGVRAAMKRVFCSKLLFLLLCPCLPESAILYVPLFPMPLFTESGEWILVRASEARSLEYWWIEWTSWVNAKALLYLLYYIVPCVSPLDCGLFPGLWPLKFGLNFVGDGTRPDPLKAPRSWQSMVSCSWTVVLASHSSGTWLLRNSFSIISCFLVHARP